MRSVSGTARGFGSPARTQILTLCTICPGTMNLLTVETLNVGQETFIESCPDTVDNAVIFEDNGETGYLYAIERKTDEELKILDAVNIYDVARVTDKEIPSEIKIFWTDDFERVGLVINDYCHAIIDFKNKVGLCRTGFPHASQTWPNGRQKLTDKDVDSFFNG